jgi:Hemolysin coregulated protein Hcp (TssD)
MSFLSKLTIDNQDFVVLSCNYRFYKDRDPSNKPSGSALGGELKVKIEATGKTEFLDWTLKEDQTKDGEIIFYKRDAMSKLRSIKFERAYCISYEETFNSENTEPLIIELIICAKKLTIGDCISENVWKI